MGKEILGGNIWNKKAEVQIDEEKPHGDKLLQNIEKRPNLEASDSSLRDQT